LESCRTRLTSGFARKTHQPVAALRQILGAWTSQRCHSQSRMRPLILSAEGNDGASSRRNQSSNAHKHRDRISGSRPVASSDLAQCHVLEHGCETHEERENTTWKIWIEYCKIAVIPLREHVHPLLGVAHNVRLEYGRRGHRHCYRCVFFQVRPKSLDRLQTWPFGCKAGRQSYVLVCSTLVLRRRTHRVWIHSPRCE
jgi:hypothetical protein